MICYYFLDWLPLSAAHIHKHKCTNSAAHADDCPLIKLAVCVINGNDGRKWPLIRGLASLCSVALLFLLGVYVSRYSHSGLLYYTEPRRCFSGQRRRPKMPCCCYHDNPRGRRRKKKKRIRRTWSKCLPRFFNLPSEPHHQLDESCTCNKPARLFLLFTGERVD